MVDRRDPIWRVLGGVEVTAWDDRMYGVVIPTKQFLTQTVIRSAKWRGVDRFARSDGGQRDPGGRRIAC